METVVNSYVLEEECIQYLSTCSTFFLTTARVTLSSTILTISAGILLVGLYTYLATLGRERVLQVINKIIFRFP